KPLLNASKVPCRPRPANKPPVTAPMTTAKTTDTRANESPNMTPIAARNANIMKRRTEKAAILSENADKNSATFFWSGHVLRSGLSMSGRRFTLNKLINQLSDLLRLTQNRPVIGSQFYFRKIIHPFGHLINQIRPDKLVIFQHNCLYRTDGETLPWLSQTWQKIGPIQVHTIFSIFDNMRVEWQIIPSFYLLHDLGPTLRIKKIPGQWRH